MKKLYYLLVIVFAFAYNHQTEAQSQRVVVIEEGTGTWCPWCTGGTYRIEQLQITYPDLIAIAVHDGDPMENQEYSSGSAFSSYPSGHINRRRRDLSIDEWTFQAALEAISFAPAYLEVETEYDESTRDLAINITTNVTQNVSGDYRLSAIIVEDGVYGRGNQWSQANAYAGSGVNVGGFEDLPNPIPDWYLAYNDVGRRILGGYSGEAGSLPGTLTKNDVHEYTFNWQLPPSMNHEYIQVVGFMINASTGDIENAAISKYLPGYSNAKPQFISTPVEEVMLDEQYSYTAVARDPENHGLTASSTNLPSWLTMSDDGLGTITLEGTPTVDGTYDFTISVSDGEWDVDQDISIKAGAVTSTNEVKFRELNIYPNPVVGQTLFVGNNLSGADYTISTVEGVELMKGQLRSNEINISGLSPSMYFIKILKDQEVYLGKMVKL